MLQQGPHVRILISRTLAELKDGRTTSLEFERLPVRALIDTGASVTIVNPEIAKTCKLRWTGMVRIVTTGGMSAEFPEHAAAISFPDTELPGFEAIRVVACPIIRRPFSCLIGRDILQKFQLIYDG